MRPNKVSSLAVALLGASVAIAVRQTFKNPKDVTFKNWAGSILHTTGVTSVEGTVVIPAFKGKQDTGVAIWVGIDGSGSGTCGKTLMQTGITISDYGAIEAWWEWWPHGNGWTVFPNIELHESDSVTMKIKTTSANSGVATIINLSTGKQVTHEFTSDEEPAPLCQATAEWIVEAYGIAPGKQKALPDFGTIVFTDTAAQASTGSVTAADGGIINMGGVGNNTVACSHGPGSSGVTFTYKS